MARLEDVGQRLRHHRGALGQSIDAVAHAIKVSRALLYRYEAGEIVKLDTLDRLARYYGTTTPALLGLGQEFITNGIAFFERLEKLEQDAEHITTVFGPLAHALTTDAYDDQLARALGAAGDAADALTSSEVQRLRRVLARRKTLLRERRPGFVNIIPIAEIQTYLTTGLTGASDAPAADRAAQRRHAIREMEHLAGLIAHPPMGVQIALTPRPLPTAGFQILRFRDQRLLVVSPFRLGEPINLRYGVAMLSSDEQALRLHESLIARLWQSSLSGSRAVDEIEKLIKARA